MKMLKPFTKFLIIVSATVLLSGCGGGGGSEPQQNPAPESGPSTLDDRMSELRTAISLMDGSVISTGSFSLNDGVLINKFTSEGMSFCFPELPLTAPNPSSASGTTTIYGCDNTVEVIHEVLTPTLVRVYIIFPEYFSQVQGSVNYGGTIYPYTGYGNLTNHIKVYDIEIVDNADGTYSFGAVDGAYIYSLDGVSVNSKYDSIVFDTNNNTVDSLNLSYGYFLMTDNGYDIFKALADKVTSMGDFVF